METTICGLHIRAETRGTPFAPEKPAAVFLHGWGSEGKAFGRLLDTAGEKYPVLAPDLPGFGGSDEPGEPWSVDDYADFVAELLASLGIRSAVLVGHSFGGRVIIRLASREELPFAVEKIVLFDSAGIRPKRSLRYHLKVRAYKLGKKALSCAPVRKCFPDALEKFQAGKGSSDYAAASPVMKATLVRAVNEDLSPLLPRIRASTLLVWGENDTATPISDGEKMEKSIPDAGLVRLPGAGHFSFADQPVICDRALRSFLGIPL